MNKTGASDGVMAVQEMDRLITMRLVALTVILVITSLLVSQGHAQTLRTVEQQVTQAVDADPGSAGLPPQQSSDEAPDPVAEQDPGQSGENLTRDQIMAMLANEVVLAPGIGLQHIRLGEPLDSVKSRLGPPRSISRSGFLPRYYNLTYLLDGGTTVVLVGRRVVERIMVTGNSAALIRTAQGARFGMDQTLIQRIYRAPTKQRRNRLEYRNRGITFHFAEQGGGQGLSDGVSRIEIYARGARGSS